MRSDACLADGLSHRVSPKTKHPGKGCLERRRNFRADETPMLSLRLSSHQLLTLRPFSSKLPTLTRLPFESTLIACFRPCHRRVRFTERLLSHPYILFLLYCIREYPQNMESPLETSKKLDLFLVCTLPEFVNAGILAISRLRRSFGGQAKIRHLARPSRNRTFMSKIHILYVCFCIKAKSPRACFSFRWSSKRKIRAEARGFKRGKPSRIRTSGPTRHRCSRRGRRPTRSRRRRGRTRRRGRRRHGGRTSRRNWCGRRSARTGALRR